MGKQKDVLSKPDKPAAVPDVEYIRAFQLFLENFQGEQLEALLFAEDAALHYSLDELYAEFLDASPSLGNLFYTQLDKLLPLFDIAAHEAQVAAFEAHKQRQRMSVKDNMHVRLNVHGSAFECPETRPNIGRVRVRDVGRFLILKGIVIRSGVVKILEGEQEPCGIQVTLLLVAPTNFWMPAGHRPNIPMSQTRIEVYMKICKTLSLC